VVATATKATGVIGLDMLAEICAAVSIPVVAIGGNAAAAAAGIRAAVDASLDAHRARRR